MKASMKSAIVKCALAMLFCLDAHAVVSLAGTRLVFDGRFREATIEVSNPGKEQVLIQAWIADANADPHSSHDLPFVLTPPLAQLAAQGKQTLRVLYEGVGMPIDRESLLHLYVLEVPRRSAALQQLNIAVRQRINVFYRPPGLAGDPSDGPVRLVWQRDTQGCDVLHVRNPTPFHVSLLNIAFNGSELREDLMLAPFSEHAIGLFGPAGEGYLRFKALTDYGGQRQFCGQVFPSPSTTEQC